MKLSTLLVVVAGIAGAAYYIAPEPAEAPPVERTAARSSEIRDPEVLATAGRLIRANGFNCPVVKLMFARGVDHRGDVFKAHCGPVGGGDGVYRDLAFRLTVRPDGTVSVRPWAEPA